MKIRFHALLVIGLFLLLSMQLSALPEYSQPQSLVTVQGVVSDIYGNPLPNAEVRLVNLSTLPVLTDANGCYHIQRGITGSGIITLKISKPGYKTVVKSNIIVHFDGTSSFVFDCTLAEIP